MTIYSDDLTGIESNLLDGRQSGNITWDASNVIGTTDDALFFTANSYAGFQVDWRDQECLITVNPNSNSSILYCFIRADTIKVNPDNGYFLYILEYAGMAFFGKNVDGDSTTIESLSFTGNTGALHTWKMSIDENYYRIYRDDTLIASGNDSSIESGNNVVIFQTTFDSPGYVLHDVSVKTSLLVIPKEGQDKQHTTKRNLRNHPSKDGVDNMNTPGGSHKYKSKRTLKAQFGVRH